MKLEIYNRPDSPVEEPVRLSFEKAGDDIYVIAVDKNGEKLSSGNLVVFRSDGTVKNCPHVSSELGFQLDELGQIKEV